MQATAGDVLVRYRALAERIAAGLCGADAASVVARATQQLADAPVAGLRERFLRSVVELASAPREPAPDVDATTLFGSEVFARAHARWRSIESRLTGLPKAEFELFEARFQARASHADIAARSGEPAAAVAARERALVERLRQALGAEEPRS
jgi:DNA-directed RNA polymerase specialized sigma24 family protein